MKKPKKFNPIAKALGSSLFKQRIVKDKIKHIDRNFCRVKGKTLNDKRYE